MANPRRWEYQYSAMFLIQLIKFPPAILKMIERMSIFRFVIFKVSRFNMPIKMPRRNMSSLRGTNNNI
ncbi:hypothetical protein DZC76_09510 [Pseudomonas sp. phDV1]|nr:hypothetical protein DZC76_09510 [Pseudomonas sp. phDV1]